MEDNFESINKDHWGYEIQVCFSFPQLRKSNY
jgi:hypothetical protein